MLMLEMTLYQLDRSTVNNFGPEREVRANRVQVETLEFTTSQGKLGTQLTAIADVRGSTGERYKSTIVFKKVKTEEADTPTNITVKSTNGDDIHLQAISLNSSDVMVRCSCLDFYWRFSLWNMRHKSLFGDGPDPYVKTTNRPPVNPGQRPGVCKHLYKMIQKIKGQGIMKNIDHSSPKDPAPMMDRTNRDIPTKQLQQPLRRVPAVKPTAPATNPPNVDPRQDQ